jgi:hypothetical protein
MFLCSLSHPRSDAYREPAMLTDLDRIVIAARYRQPVVEAFCRVLGAEVVGSDRLPLWSAERTVLRAGVSEIEVLEPKGVGAIADFVGRRGPGLFAVGFASAAPEAFRANLETRGVYFAEHEGQLFLTSDEGVDLPGLNLVVTPAKEREPAGLLRRLCGVTLLHRDAKPADNLVRLLGIRPAGLSEVSEPVAGSIGTVLRVGEGLGSHLAILAPSGNATPIGRFFYRHGPGIHLASAMSEKLPAIREGLAFLGHTSPALSADGLLPIPARLLGGVRLAVFARAADCVCWDISSPLFDTPAAWA